MHALRKYVEEQMDQRAWRPSDLASASGITKQVISGLLSDQRDNIDRMPTDKTIDGLSNAFSVDRSVVLAVIGEAMGLPVGRTVAVPDASRIPSDELLRELARRLAAAEEPRSGVTEPAPVRAINVVALNGAHEGPGLDAVRWAARPGAPHHMADANSGEESQDSGVDDPA